MNLMVVIFIPIVVVMSFGFAIAYFRIIRQKSKNNDVGTIIFKLDYEARKIRIERQKNVNTAIPNLTMSRNFYEGKWYPFDQFLEHFTTVSQENIREKLAEIKKTKEAEKIVLIVKSHEKYNLRHDNNPLNFLLQMNLYQSTRNNNIYGSIVWKDKLRLNEELEIHKIKRRELLEIRAAKIAFLAFNINALLSVEGEREFITTLKFIIAFKAIYYFVHGGKIVLVIWGNTEKIVQKRVTKIYDKIRKVGERNGLHGLYNGVGQFINNHLQSWEEINDSLVAISYLTAHSVLLDSKIASGKYEIATPNFLEYQTVHRTFQSYIKAKTIKTKFLTIRKMSTNRKIMNYGFPDLPNIAPKYLDKLVLDYHNKIELMEAHAQSALLQHHDAAFLLDVTEQWISNNIVQIAAPKRIIYVLNFTSANYDQKLQALLTRMKVEKKHFGVKIDQINPKLISFVINVKPEFIVISKALAKRAHEAKIFVKLISIANIARKNKANLIYEFPSKHLDLKQKAAIGLDFFYE